MVVNGLSEFKRINQLLLRLNNQEPIVLLIISGRVKNRPEKLINSLKTTCQNWKSSLIEHEHSPLLAQCRKSPTVGVYKRYKLTITVNA